VLRDISKQGNSEQLDCFNMATACLRVLLRLYLLDRPLQGFVRGYEKGGLSGWSGIVSPIFTFSSVRPRWFVQKQQGLPRVRRGYSAQIRLNVSYRPHILYFVQCLVTHSLQILRSRE